MVCEKAEEENASSVANGDYGGCGKVMMMAFHPAANMSSQ